MNYQYALFVSCNDEPGLIHKITGVLLKQNLNIIENHECIDEQSNTFVMRTGITGNIQESTLLADLKRDLPKNSEIQLYQQTRKKIILMATKEPHCLGDLLLRHHSGELNADILAVVSQFDSLKPLVDRFEIPFHCVPVGEKSREAHEEALIHLMKPYKADHIILAKYMRIFSPNFVAAFPNQMINIHHSFLPAFKGANPYAQAYARGVKIIGATAHFVNEDLDEGPIIAQSVIPCDHSQNAASLSRAGKEVERTVLAKAVKLVLENRVVTRGLRTLVFES